MRPAEPSDDHLFESDNFEAVTKPDRVRWDDDEPDDGETTYLGAEHGPDPVPPWVITDGFARQAEIGLLKTGKEAEVFLVERTLGDDRNLLACKRYRSNQHRAFRNDAAYRAGWEMVRGRAKRAIDKKTQTGMGLKAGIWAAWEFELLGLLWSAGVPVPYPVQMLGLEIMMQYLGDDDGAAFRLVESRASGAVLRDLHDQAIEIFKGIARCGLVHADLSPYNLLVWDDRLWVIDLPQAMKPFQNPNAFDFLHRDVTNVIGWFARKGIDTDPEEVFAEVLTELLGVEAG
ncbi:MAG: kinase 1 [Actinomycetota bacterium]|nr:kinase 1 [Actinomycetota bacterium]